MWLVIVNIFSTCLSLVLSQNCPSKGISSYASKATVAMRENLRYTTIQTGNYTVQALLTFAEGRECEKVTQTGLTLTYALKYAIDKANNRSVAKYATIGLQLDNNCRSLPVTMARGIEIVSLHRPNSVCRSDFLRCGPHGSINKSYIKRATGIIGTSMSFTTIPLASLMSLYYIPQVSYSASSRLLSKQDLYKSFFRTIPSDTNQVSVMVDIFKKFNWNYIFAIGSDDDYGKLGISELKKMTTGSDICIAQDEYIPYQSRNTKKRAEQVIDKIIAIPSATVVVLFCYVKDLGTYIMERAKEKGVKRVWLTSEAWNPAAAKQKLDLRNELEGILTVSIKSHKLDFLIEYMRNEIINSWDCNMWLQKYLEYDDAFKCKPTNITADKTTLTGKNCSVRIDDIMNVLKVLPGNIDNLVDATTALTRGIQAVLEKKCADSSSSCYFEDLSTKEITKAMFNVSFANEQGRRVSFNSLGDPKNAFYTIENLQVVNGKYEYVPVGSWNQLDNGKSKLELNETQIQWPPWFYNGKKDAQFPPSRCSKQCQPGTAVAGRVGCCWACADCLGNNYSSTVMASSCSTCKKYEHTLDHKSCLPTPILWLKITDPAGMSITIISALGLLIMAVVCVALFQFRSLIAVNDESPHVITISCLLLICTFVYGPLHITEPTHRLCQIRNSVFFLLLMMYAAILLIKSKFMTNYLNKHAGKSFRGSLLLVQVLFMFLLFMLELVSVIAWLYIDEVQIQEFRENNVHEIWKQCEVSFTAARLVSTFIPCIVLIIATFCAFRERNLEHSFYEPKFLSFTCIALCIIIVAFLPTFKYVVGIYKAIVMAFTMDVFGYTFMACLVLPKVYVAIMRHRRGKDEFPVKPGSIKKSDQTDNVQPKSSISIGDRTSTLDLETTKNESAPSLDDAEITTNGDVVDEERNEVVNGYNNQTYDKAVDEAAHCENEKADKIEGDNTIF